MGQENNSVRQYHKAETVNRIRKDDGALLSLSLLETAIPTRKEKAHDNIQQEKRPSYTILSETDIKEDEQDRDEQQLFRFTLDKEITKIEETRVKTHNQSTVLSNCQVYQDTSSVCQPTYSVPNTPEQRTLQGQDAESSLQKFSLETRLCASEPTVTWTNSTGPECCGETRESQDLADNSEHEYSDDTHKSKNSETNETT